jgi:hypothetical protein
MFLLCKLQKVRAPQHAFGLRLSRWKFSTYRNRAKQGLKGETYDIKRLYVSREFPRKGGLNDAPSEVSRTHFAKGNVLSGPKDFIIGIVLL